MYTHISICIHIFMHTYTRRRLMSVCIKRSEIVNSNKCECIYIYIYIYIYTYTYMCIYKFMHTYTRRRLLTVCMKNIICSTIYIYSSIHIHIHIHIHMIAPKHTCIYTKYTCANTFWDTMHFNFKK